MYDDLPFFRVRKQPIFPVRLPTTSSRKFDFSLKTSRNSYRFADYNNSHWLKLRPCVHFNFWTKTTKFEFDIWRIYAFSSTYNDYFTTQLHQFLRIDQYSSTVCHLLNKGVSQNQSLYQPRKFVDEPESVIALTLNYYFNELICDGQRSVTSSTINFFPSLTSFITKIL